MANVLKPNNADYFWVWNAMPKGSGRLCTVKQAGDEVSQYRLSKAGIF